MTRPKCRAFTLLEIIICIAILSASVIGIGWQMKGMLAIHQFNKNIANFLADLRKAQLVALCDRVDIDLNIYEEGGHYQYSFSTDDPLLCFINKKITLTGIQEIKTEKKKLKELKIHLYPSGRISPEKKITFLCQADRGVTLDLTSPLCIELKNK